MRGERRARESARECTRADRRVKGTAQAAGGPRGVADEAGDAVRCWLSQPGLGRARKRRFVDAGQVDWPADVRGRVGRAERAAVLLRPWVPNRRLPAAIERYRSSAVVLLWYVSRPAEARRTDVPRPAGERLEVPAAGKGPGGGIIGLLGRGQAKQQQQQQRAAEASTHAKQSWPANQAAARSAGANGQRTRYRQQARQARVGEYLRPHPPARQSIAAAARTANSGHCPFPSPTPIDRSAMRANVFAVCARR